MKQRYLPVYNEIRTVLNNVEELTKGERSYFWQFITGMEIDVGEVFERYLKIAEKED